MLVCCLTIGHVFWCGASSSVMHVGVVPHYRPCLLVWYLTIDHICWSNATVIDILLVECRMKKDSYKSGAICTEVPLYQTCLLIQCHSDMPACTVQLYQTCMLGSFIHIHLFVKCCSIRQGIWSVTNPSDIPTCRMPLPQVCKTCLLSSWTPS